MVKLFNTIISMKLDLLTNATVVDDAVRFVSSKSKDNLKSSYGSNEGDKEGSNEPDYDAVTVFP
jgi:hypothetical protein